MANRTKGAWTHWEVVPWGDANLHCLQSSPFCKTNTNQQQQQQLDPEETVRLCWSTGVCWSDRKQIKHHQKFLGMLLSTKSQQEKFSRESKVNQYNSVVSKDQHQRTWQRWARWTSASDRVSPTACWVILTHFPNIPSLLQTPPLTIQTLSWVLSVLLKGTLMSISSAHLYCE